MPHSTTSPKAWCCAASGRVASQHPEAIQAQKESGLPMPSVFERYDSPQVTFYSSTDQPD